VAEQREEGRRIPLVGQDNFRDLGGYETADGRRVKWRRLYRSGELNELTDEDLGMLEEIGIRTVVDLRGENEAERKGPVRIPAGATHTSIAIEPGDLGPIFAPAFASGDFSTVPADLLLEINRAYIRDWRTHLHSLLAIAAEPARCPLVFHCTHGKDRTGIGAAILLSALGVPWKTVMEDYLLSNDLRRPQAEAGLQGMRERAAHKRGISPEEVDVTNIRGLFFVDPSYLAAAYEELIELFGTLDDFIRSGLGWSDDSLHNLRDHLLE